MEGSPSFEQPHISLESLRESAEAKLHAILYAPLTVENIESFADTALDNTIELVQKLVREYQTNPNLEGDASLDPQQQEDAICEKLDLPNIQDILQRIIEVQGNIESIKQYLEQPQESSGTVITPPDHTEQPLTGEAGNQPFEKKKLIPRLLTLMYILQTDFEVDIQDKEQVQILEGEVTENMMRKTPYVRVTIPDLERSVYICDEEGNVSYVFDTGKLDGLHIPLDDLDIDGKQDKNTLIAMHPSVGVRVVQTPNWRNKMKEYLEQELPEQSINAQVDDITMSEEASRSEFEKREHGNWLSYEEWVKEVKEAWDAIPESERPTNAWTWYHQERLKHQLKWTSLPKKQYSKYGFSSMTEILGKKNKFEKDYLPFSEWTAEVKKMWDMIPTDQRPTALQDWYELARKAGSFEETWPDETKLKNKYSKKGFRNLNQVLGVKNKFEKDYLPFSEWTAEVKKEWNQIPDDKKPTNMEDWYTTERNNRHVDTWPYLGILKSTYGDHVNLHTLVGKENKHDKEYLPYGTWLHEVKTAWDQLPDNKKPKNIWKWYEVERKQNHIKTWPGQSDVKNKYPDFLGIKSIVQ